jgi:hypothetical protein
MCIYAWGVIRWMTRKGSDLGNLILERTDDNAIPDTKILIRYFRYVS